MTAVELPRRDTTYQQQPERLTQRGDIDALIRRNAALRTALIELKNAVTNQPNTDLQTALARADEVLGEQTETERNQL